jgi:hypothetical protein
MENYFAWNHVARNLKTRKQLLKSHRRLIKDAEPVGQITLIFNKPRACPKGVEPVIPEECDRIREKLATFGLDPSDQPDLWRLDRAGQLAEPHLYDHKDTEPITAFTEKEAETLLGYMIWDHSHEDHFITEATEDGERHRATWKTAFSMPNMKCHCSGERSFGVKKGEMTRQIILDLDRHSGAVNGEEHTKKTLQVGEILKNEFSKFRFAPEINPKNGSVKFFGWLPDYTPMAFAVQQAEKIRAVLQERLPEYDFSKLEIFPSTCPQVFAPLRADKIMVIGDGKVGKVKRKRYERIGGGKRKYIPYEAVSCAQYLNWVCFSDKPYNSDVFDKCLRESVANLPDGVAETPSPEKRPSQKKSKSTGQGMGSIGKLKGCCASTLVKFWSEEVRPEDDTIGKYLIVSLRILKYEGMEQEDAVEWVEERLESLKYTEFSDRLTVNFRELQRNIAAAANAVWSGNGYQKDPGTSEMKLKASVMAWARKGFFLHDPSSWHKAPLGKVPEAKLIWTVGLLALLPEVAEVAYCTVEEARKALELLLGFVEENNELSESMVGRLLGVCGINGKSRQKQHDVRKLLERHGLLIKQRNYFIDKATGYRHGNFYVCGTGVRFEEEGGQVSDTPPCIYYLSLDSEFESEPCLTEEEMVMERRLLACDWRYQRRRRLLVMEIRQAA